MLFVGAVFITIAYTEFRGHSKLGYLWASFERFLVANLRVDLATPTASQLPRLLMLRACCYVLLCGMRRTILNAIVSLVY